MIAMPKLMPNAGPKFVAAPVKVEVAGVVRLATVLEAASNEVGGVADRKYDVELVGENVMVEVLIELAGTRFVKKVGVLIESAGCVTAAGTFVVELTGNCVANVGVVVGKLVVVMLVSTAGMAVAGVEKTAGTVGTVEAGGAASQDKSDVWLQALQAAPSGRPGICALPRPKKQATITSKVFAILLEKE